MSYKYINDDMKSKVDVLLEGDHGEAVAAFGKECGNVAVEEYKKSVLKGCVRASLLGVAGLTMLVGAVKLGHRVIGRRVEKGVEKFIYDK